MATHLILDMATVKNEPGVKPEPGIKHDPDGDVKMSPGAEDDELYEDAGDLDFYDATEPQDPQGNAFLAHLPKYLYDQWAQLDDEEELVVGRVRTWVEVDKSGQQVQKFAILVDSNNPIHQSVPKEYTLEMRDSNLLNTFMFTEADLPGFKNKNQGGPNNNIPAYLRPKPAPPKESVKPEPGRSRKREPYYRKAIPKKTVLGARFRKEVNAQPVMTPEAKHILAMRASDALKPKATTSIMSGTRNPAGIIHAGTTVGNSKMNGFIVGLRCALVVIFEWLTDINSVLSIPRPRQRRRERRRLLVWSNQLLLTRFWHATTTSVTGL